MTRVLPIAPAAVPTLDELATDPARVSSLPPAALQAMLYRCLTVQSALMGALLAAPAPAGVASADTGDRLLTVPEVAARIGMSVSWVEKHTSNLPARVSVAGTPRWRKSDLERWIKNRPQYGKVLT
jgi:predicted DNA-binding transcriptional regulator AlpA